MRSLTSKLTLAFLFVSIVGVALIALFVQQRTKSEFGRFVLDRSQLDLVSDLTNYYAQAGSWEGIDRIVQLEPGGYRGHNPVAFLAPLTLLDEDRRVVYSGTVFTAGEQLSRAQMERAVPVTIDDRTVGWVIFSEAEGQTAAWEESPEARFLANVNQAVMLGAIGAVVLALVIGVLLARAISRPVREVTQATHVVAGGELGYQVPVRTRDELGELAASFNRMSADLARANELRRQMIADIAHDLRTPLNVILGYMEALSSGKLQATPATLDIIYTKGRHLQRLIDDLRTLALADAGELSLNRRPVEARSLLEHIALAHMVHAQAQGIALRVAGPDAPAIISVDPERMAQVLGNLVSNALRYTSDGGEVTLTVDDSAGMVRLHVRDSGSGISEEELPLIFDRFYRTDKSRHQNGQSGLGLAIARSIVEAHGGAIAVASGPGQGTTFTISLPAERSAGQSRPDISPAPG